MSDIDLLKRRLDRERKAREQAESILEEKSLELYHVNQKLKEFNEALENEVAQRSLQIADSELKYRTLVETAQDIIFNISTTGHFLFVNGMATKLFQYSEEEIIGSHFTKFIPKDHEQAVFEFYRNFRDDKVSASYLEFPIITKTGPIRWIGQNVRRVELNNEVYFSAYARDITDRKNSDFELVKAKVALIGSETKYRNMIENMELGINDVNIEGNITKANERFCEMTGYSKTEL